VLFSLLKTKSNGIQVQPLKKHPGSLEIATLHYIVMLILMFIFNYCQFVILFIYLLLNIVNLIVYSYSIWIALLIFDHS